MRSSWLRIGVVCFPSFGGSGVVAAELAQGMARRGHHVHLLATAPPARQGANGGPVFFNQVAVVDYPLFDHAPYALAVAAKVVEVVEEHPLDILHVHYAVPHATSALLASQVLGDRRPRVVTTLHGTDVTHVGLEPSLLTINRFSVLASDGITVPSEFLRQAAYSELGLPAERPVEVIPNFLNTEHFAPAGGRDRGELARLFGASGAESAATAGDDVPVLVHVSNFRPVKRVSDVVHVAARVAERTPVRLLMIGDGPERTRATCLVRELGLSHRVTFLGAVSDFAKYLPHAAVFVLSSETESFGLAALEALSSGVPVVAYRVGGLPEVIADGEVGCLTPAGDIDAMAAAIVTLLGDRERHQRMARAARQHALRYFSREPALDRYEAYYERVLQSGTRRESC